MSPDPLEYVDGMTKYRAAFLHNFVDPLGLVITKCGCYFLNDHRIPGWEVFTTTDDCQNACCGDEDSDDVRRCRGYKKPLTPDETGAAGLCAAIPKGVDRDKNGISDFRECEDRVMWLMNVVLKTRTSEGKKGSFCHKFMNAVRNECNCPDDTGTVNLSEGCTITFQRVYPRRALCTKVWNWRKRKYTWICYTGHTDFYGRPTGYSDHAIAKVCCGVGGQQSCMYFDIGAENVKRGQFGGNDRWFPLNDPGFKGDIDPSKTHEDWYDDE